MRPARNGAVPPACDQIQRMSGYFAAAPLNSNSAIARVVLVPNSLVDEFSARLARRVGGLGVGDPTQPTTVVGPLITRASAERIRAGLALHTEQLNAAEQQALTEMESLARRAFRRTLREEQFTALRGLLGFWI